MPAATPLTAGKQEEEEAAAAAALVWAAVTLQGSAAALQPVAALQAAGVRSLAPTSPVRLGLGCGFE